MNVLELTLLLALMAFAAGFPGSLTGMGGGVVIVPGLTLLFGVDIRYAIETALVSVIATSSGAAAVNSASAPQRRAVELQNRRAARSQRAR